MAGYFAGIRWLAATTGLHEESVIRTLAHLFNKLPEQVAEDLAKYRFGDVWHRVAKGRYTKQVRGLLYTVERTTEWQRPYQPGARSLPYPKVIWHTCISHMIQGIALPPSEISEHKRMTEAMQAADQHIKDYR